ncbi:ABC transporter ATP-binding protein [Acidobacteriota bacterium]
MKDTLIELKNISRTYQMGSSQVRALVDFSYTIPVGDFLAIMGSSGSGKSTLMNILGCLDRPSKGQYYLENQEISTLNKNQLALLRNRKIGFIFQNFNLLTRTSALDNTILPLLYANIPRKQAAAKSMESLAAVGLKGREHHKTNELSGGEMQRVAIARALVNTPSLILADEPTGNLDTSTGDEVMEIFRKLNREKGITIILVTHEPDIARTVNRRIYLKDGHLIKED